MQKESIPVRASRKQEQMRLFFPHLIPSFIAMYSQNLLCTWICESTLFRKEELFVLHIAQNKYAAYETLYQTCDFH